MSTAPLLIRWTLDYGDHYASLLKGAEAEDREKLVAYGEIIEEKPPTDEAVKVFIVGYDHEGWEARGLVEETQTEIGPHAIFERLPDVEGGQ